MKKNFKFSCILMSCERNCCCWPNGGNSEVLPIKIATPSPLSLDSLLARSVSVKCGKIYIHTRCRKITINFDQFSGRFECE